MLKKLDQIRKDITQRVRSFEKSPWSILIRKRKVTYLIIAFLLFFGIFQIRSLPRELQPEVEIPFGVINSVYPGASPLDIEEQITKKIESRLTDIDGVKRIESSSNFGVSSISVEFEAGEDLENSIRKLKDKVDTVKNDLPEDATDPSVFEVSFSDFPFLILSLQGQNYDKSNINDFAEDLKDKIKGVSGVQDVKVVGGEKKEITVNIDPGKLNEFGLSLNQISSSISSNNINLPAGSIEIGDYYYTVRIKNQFKEAREIEDLVVGVNNGVSVRLGDIAEVKEGFEKRSSISRLGIGGNQSQESVSVQVFKKTGEDITRVGDKVREKVEDERGKSYPEDVKVVTTMDTVKYIEESISDLTQNGLGTVFIILLLLLFFLGIREALIAALAVPFSFFISFIVMSVLDQSLNFITLFSLVLALGLLVDSAIVIVEGMYRQMNQFKVSGYAAAMLTVKNYAAPLVSGMLTTVAAFLPLLFVKGIFGQFLIGIPIVVIATLTAALFVSFTIITTVGVKFLKSKEEKKTGGIRNYVNNWMEKTAHNYSQKIKQIISVRRTRIIILVGSWLLFFASIALPATGFLKLQAFGATDAESYYITIETPVGTVLEKTDELTRKIEERLNNFPEVENYVTSVGTGLGRGMGSGGSSENVANIVVNLTNKDTRKITSPELTKMAREELKDITEGEIEFIEESGGPPTGSPLEARISGTDLNELDRISNDMKLIMEKIPGAIDVKTNIEYLPGEFVIDFNREVLAQYGLSTVQVGMEIRNSITGSTDNEILRDGDEIKINIAYPENEINMINNLESITIQTPLGEEVAIGELADIRIGSSISSIKRRDQERTVAVTGNIETGTNTNEIMAEFKNQMNNYELPKGYLVSYGGANEEQNEVYADMFQKMIIGIILILFILVLQFNSYRQTAIILFTIPLAMIGVFWGMAAAGLTLDIPAFIGIISLSGIVVNNAIILIDSINKKRKQGIEIIEAVGNAGKTRFRPILLTTITTVMGLLPLSIREPDWRNMGFTIIFGLTFSAILTLFVVPSMYVSLEVTRRKK